MCLGVDIGLSIGRYIAFLDTSRYVREKIQKDLHSKPYTGSPQVMYNKRDLRFVHKLKLYVTYPAQLGNHMGSSSLPLSAIRKPYDFPS